MVTTTPERQSGPPQIEAILLKSGTAPLDGTQWRWLTSLNYSPKTIPDMTKSSKSTSRRDSLSDSVIPPNPHHICDFLAFMSTLDRIHHPCFDSHVAFSLTGQAYAQSHGSLLLCMHNSIRKSFPCRGLNAYSTLVIVIVRLCQPDVPSII